MKLTQRKLQKIMDKYYKDANRINVDKITSNQDKVKGLNGHTINNDTFSITSPYVDTMDEPIVLSLYYDEDMDDFILSDDGITYSSALSDSEKPSSTFINYINNRLMKLPKRNCKAFFYSNNQSFQVTFQDIQSLPNAYHALMQIIIAFQSIVDYKHSQKAQTIDNQKLDTENWTKLHEQILSHPNDINKNLYNSEENQRKNGIAILDNIEGLMKIHATEAYVRSIKEQVQTANKFLLAFSSIKNSNQARINAQHLTRHLNRDVTNFMNQFKQRQQEIGNK